MKRITASRRLEILRSEFTTTVDNSALAHSQDWTCDGACICYVAARASIALIFSYILRHRSNFFDDWLSHDFMWRTSSLSIFRPDVWRFSNKLPLFLLSPPLRAYSAAAAMSPPTMNAPEYVESVARKTQILPINATKLGAISYTTSKDGIFDELDVQLDGQSQDARHLRLAADRLRDSNVPVAFPTETVYGLGADATRSDAVKGIYAAKQRPSDNPLIVHFASLRQLEQLLSSSRSGEIYGASGGTIPPIYLPLIRKFWPGPLTIILPNPKNSPLAPEVTAGLSTFGARIPRNLLALLLIKLSDRPIAAPSANASTKPSPTAAEHVKEDLDGRIEYIIDGGPCDVGVESTVVDGLSDPPAILRPGGISIERIRECEGWENTIVGYEDASMKKGAPRAPGMKYRHYSPKAKVFLYDAGADLPSQGLFEKQGFKRLGFICTRKWKTAGASLANGRKSVNGSLSNGEGHERSGASVLDTMIPFERPDITSGTADDSRTETSTWRSELGDHATDVARDLFWALRELDRKGCDVICVEGISAEEGDVAAAVMNRLKKAAEVQLER